MLNATLTRDVQGVGRKGETIVGPMAGVVIASGDAKPAPPPPSSTGVQRPAQDGMVRSPNQAR